jgi:predicted TIM-barrel fold metal-dependent hydrolase
MWIDSHLHVWRRDLTFPEPAVTTVSPLSDIPIELLRQYVDDHGVRRAVLVQPLFPGEDNSYVAECAVAEPQRWAAVCVVDPRSPSAPQRLEYWIAQRGCRGLRLRPRVPAEAECFGTAATYALWETAQRLGVAVSLLADPEHLPRIRELALRFHDVPVIIDHLAHPRVADGWQCKSLNTLRDLAECENVRWKVSGFAYYSPAAYPYTDCREIVQGLYKICGATRLLWGSDFPHVLLHTTYRRSMSMLDLLLGDLASDDDLALIRGGNALGLYWPQEVAD